MPPTAMPGGKFHVDTHQTLEEAAYHYLREAIVSGELAPGTKLVGSRLALKLRVSRITIANALKRLISEGFVVGTPHREALVASLDETSLREIFLMRYALEDVVMREAAKHASPAIISRLSELDEHLRISIEEQDVTAYRRLEREYHLLLYAASELPMIAALLADLWDRLEPYRGRRYNNLRLNSGALTEHRAIRAALERRDGAGLAAAMRAHVDQGYERFRQALELTAMSTGLPEIPQARSTGKTADYRSPPGSLRAAFDAIPDQRRGQGKVHAQSSVLALAVCAMLCGVRSEYGVARWGQACHPAIRMILGLSADRGPSGATVHRVFRHLDRPAFIHVTREWFVAHGVKANTLIDTAADVLDHRDLEGIHGEKLPGADMIAAVAAEVQAVLAEAAAPEAHQGPLSAQNALAELPMLLLAGRTVTANAVLAQRELSRQILLQSRLAVLS